ASFGHRPEQKPQQGCAKRDKDQNIVRTHVDAGRCPQAAQTPQQCSSSPRIELFQTSNTVVKGVGCAEDSQSLGKGSGGIVGQERAEGGQQISAFGRFLIHEFQRQCSDSQAGIGVDQGLGNQ